MYDGLSTSLSREHSGINAEYDLYEILIVGRPMLCLGSISWKILYLIWPCGIVSSN